MKKIAFLLIVIVALASCSGKHTYVVKESNGNNDTSIGIGYGRGNVRISDVEPQRPVIKSVQPEGMIPKASAFKMSGNYENNVAITIAPDGKLTYFPAPSDITQASKPVSLGNGWWLNNQGISENSVFTTFTFDDYSKLSKVPSPEELKAAVIPGAVVTQMTVLPYSINEARGNISEIKKILSEK